MYRKFLFLSFLALSLSFHHLEAFKIRTEYYLKEQVPKEYEELTRGRLGENYTLIFLEEISPNRTLFIQEKALLSKEIRELSSFRTNEKNILVIEPLGYAPGVPVTFTFKDSKKKSCKKEITVVPHRLYVKSSVDHAQIEATLIQPHPAVYTVKCTGFAKNEELLFTSVAYGEKIERKIQVSDTSLCLMPGVVNEEGGITRLSFARPSGEVLKLELPWGWEWMKYALYYDVNGEPKSIVESEEFSKRFPVVASYFRSKR